MRTVRLAPASSTVLWSGDVVILGGGLAGVTAALVAAGRGLRVGVFEAGPTLGTEIGNGWLDRLPTGRLAGAIGELCAKQNAARADHVDVLVATLAFDRLLETAGVFACVRVQPVRPLEDPATHRLTGVEVVGKSGRQRVEAPVVVDATPGRAFSRALLGLTPATVARAERRLYAAGVELAAEGLTLDGPAELGLSGQPLRVTPAAWTGDALIAVPVPCPAGSRVCDLLLPSQELAVRAFALLRQSQPAFAKSVLVDVAPGLLADYADAPPAGTWPRGTGLHVLPQGRDLADELARTEAAVHRLAWQPRRRRALPQPAGTEDATHTLTVRELVAAPEQDLAPTQLPAAVARLHEPRDVVVAGFGTGGVFAAAAAAEGGATVTVLDPATVPGGIATAGNIHSYYHGTRGGMQDRLDEQVSGLGAALGPVNWGFQPAGKAVVLGRALQQTHIDVRQGHTVFGVVREGNRLEGVVTADESGYHLFPCRIAIDATGDGDLAVAAGAAFTLGRDGDGFPQPFSYTPSFVKDGKRGHRNFDAGWVDPTDTLDVSRAHLEGRRRIWEQGPFSDARHYGTLASILGVREGRFISGRARLTFSDFLNGRRYPDTIGEGYAHYDNHAIDYAEESDWARRHVVFFGLWREMCSGEVPFSVLLPAGVEGVLLACRALSVDHDLHQLLRMQRDVQKLGEVCGVAAALAVARGVLPSAVPLTDLQAALRARGLLPKAPAEPVLARPAAECLAALGSDKSGLAMWRLASGTSDAPDWQGFFAVEADANRRFCGAVAATLARAGCPAARQVLLDTIRDRVADPRLGTKSPPRFVVAAMALGEVRDPAAAGALAEILRQEAVLDAPTAVLVLRALGQSGDAGTAVPAIRAFLARARGEEFRVALWGCDPAWTTSLRFAVVTRAVRSLLALGSIADLDLLAPYLNDPRLLVRRLARRIRAAARPAG